jgi:hypothetical protein
MIDWVEDDADPQLSIFWLSGMAGTGKTAIARSFEDKMNENLALGATFFVDRLDTPRRDPARIVQTLAFDLAQIDPGLPEQMSLVFRDVPNIKSMPLMTQVQRLIKKPLTTVHPRDDSILLIIDALDECAFSDGIKLITALVESLSELPIKLLVTSRFELDLEIVSGYSNVRHTSFRLHEVKDEVVARDIRLYYRHCFEEICSKSRKSNQLTTDFLNKLVVRAGTLFIYATTFMKIVKVSRGDPFEKSLDLLELSNSSNDALFSTSIKHHDLDKLYHYVLEEAIKDDVGDVDPIRISTIQIALECVVFAVEPLSIQALSRLLVIDNALLIEDFRRLTPVLMTGDIQTGRIRPLDQSFVDFLREDGRNTRGLVQLDRQKAHAHLAEKSLFCVKSILRLDMCSIRDPSLENKDVLDLPLRVKQHYTFEVQYAIRNWPHHLASCGDRVAPLLASLKTLCARHVLHWIEAASVLGSISRLHHGVSAILQYIKVKSFTYLLI